MCLKVVTSRETAEGNFVGYKVFIKGDDTQGYCGAFRDYTGDYRVFKLKEHVKKSPYSESIIYNYCTDDIVGYPSGFHIFTNINDAMRAKHCLGEALYVVIKVSYTKILASGIEDWAGGPVRVIVADAIILEEEC